MSLPSTFFNMTWLKDLNLCGCSKLVENLGSVESVDMNGHMASSGAIFETFLKNSFWWISACPFLSNVEKFRIHGLAIVLSVCFFFFEQFEIKYSQSQGNPQAMFRIHIACLFSLQELDLSGNNFGCLPKSIAQLSNLNDLKVNNCTSLQSFPKLPLNLGYIDGFG